MSGHQENPNGNYEQLQTIGTEHSKTQEDVHKVTGRRQAKRNRNRLIAALGLMVVLATAIALMVPAISMTRDTLICGMEAHAHSDACYEMVLTCGQEESEAHEHTQACYERQLVCALPEHEHTSDCYEHGDGSIPGEAVADSEAADQVSSGAAVEGATAMADGAVSEEAAEAGEDTQASEGAEAASDAADADDASSDAADAEADSSSAAAATAPAGTVAGLDIQAEDPMPAQSFTADLKDADDNVVLTVAVEAPQGAFPKGTFMKIDGIPAQDVQKHVEEAIQNDPSIKGNQKVQQLTAVDICFFDEQGNEIEPAKKVEVKITSDAVREYQDPMLVHVTQKDAAQKVDAAKIKAEAAEAAEQLTQAATAAAEAAAAEAQATADSDDPEAAQAAADEAAQAAAQQVIADAAEAAQAAAPDPQAARDAAQAKSDVKAKEGEAAYKEADIVKKVQIVNQFDDDKTRGNENTLKFKTDKFSPYVIVELKEITTEYLAADGNTYKITVAYKDDAQIPDGSTLEVTEVAQGSDAYDSYMAASAEQLGVEVSDVSFARFFDIGIMYDGQKVEPQSTVAVKIEYADAIQIRDNQNLSVVHFAESGTEVRNDVAVNDALNEVMFGQESFSVTGTILTNNPSQGSNYMVLVKYNGKYYIVNNDGTLTETPNTVIDGQEQPGKVDVDDPMLWTYTGSNLYHHTLQVDFGSNQCPSDYYNKYIDATSETGLTSEHKDDGKTTLKRNSEPTWDWSTWPPRQGEFVYYTVQDRQSMRDSALVYEDHKLKSRVTGEYIGIEETENGTLRLVGRQSNDDAAEIYLGEAADVSPVHHLNHTVNHIDISIEGTAGVDVPLAYGKYYNENHEVILDVTEDKTISLKREGVGITTDDMKGARIVAYTKDASGKATEIDDAFVVTGYSANAATEWSTPQVRIEGQFKVADLPPVSSENAQIQDPRDGQTKSVWDARLNNKIYYSVTAVKTITFDLVDPEVGQLYDEKGNPLTLTIDVAFSASFDFWDSRNECPPLHWDANWQRGYIPDHNLSGMDFVLGGNPDDVNSRVLALEITKVIVDESGNRIKSKTPITNSFTIYKAKDGTSESDLNVRTIGSEQYNTQNYQDLHNKTISVGDDGLGIVYDYDVSQGMYLVSEDAKTVPQRITDKTGKVWDYVGTRIETEYAWRNSPDNDGKRHKSATYTYETDEDGKVTAYTVDDGGNQTPLSGNTAAYATDNGGQTMLNDAFVSVPEVLGNYTGVDGESHRNGFLEFFVYNVYASPKVDVPVTKTWKDFTGDEFDWEATFKLQYAPVYEGQDNTNQHFLDVLDADGHTQEITVTKAQSRQMESLQALKAELENWSGSDEEKATKEAQVTALETELSSIIFKDLPKYGTDASGNTFRYQYSLEELSYVVKQNGSELYKWSKDGGYDPDDAEHHYQAFYPHDAGELSDEDGDYHIDVTNAKKNVRASEYIDITLKKQWAEALQSAVDKNSFATFELRRYEHTEYRDLSHLTTEDITADPILVRVVKNGEVLDWVKVQPNTGLYLAGSFKPRTENQTISYTYNDGTGEKTVAVTAEGPNAGKELVRSNEFFVTGEMATQNVADPEDASKQIKCLDITFNDDGENLAGGVQGARILDTRPGTAPLPDRSFRETVTLTDPDWQHVFEHLLYRETSEGDDDKNENVTVYDYYLVETSSNPESMAEYFLADSDGNVTDILMGDSANRIDDNATVVAKNDKSNRLKVTKEWRGVADTTGFPTVKFTLYQGWLNGDAVSDNDDESWKYVTQEVGHETKPPKGTPGSYEGVELSDGAWTWTCPEELPEEIIDPTNNRKRKVGYYVKEDPSSGSTGNAAWKFYYYHSDNGTPDVKSDDRQTNAAHQGGQAGIPGENLGSTGGTITICNQMGKYLQMDIKKQFFELGDDGSWANTTANHKANAAVLKFQVIRAVKNASGQWIDNAGNVVDQPVWTDYGDALYGGYDQDGRTVFQNGGQNSFFLESGGGDWHFRIRDEQGGANNKDIDKIGLPANGYYVQNGESVSVSYAYSYREVGVYQYAGRNDDGTLKLDPYEWDWYSSMTPTRYVDADGQHENQEQWPLAHPNQDGERVANFQASNLSITKNWAGEETDVDEVYIKVYRVRESETTPASQIFADRASIQAYAEQHPDFDFTSEIAADVRDKGWHHYIDDPSNIDTTSEWLVIRRNADGAWSQCTISVNNALVGSVDANNKKGEEYTYYIEEVGYGTRDENGNLIEAGAKNVYDDGDNAVSTFKPTYSKFVNGEWRLIGRSLTDEAGITLGPKGENQLEVVNTSGPQTSYTVTKEFKDKGQTVAYPTDGSAQVVMQLQQRYKDPANNDEWTEWAPTDKVITLPQPKPTNKPENFIFDGNWSTDEATAAWYSSKAAWSYTWTGLDVKKKLDDEHEATLYYRAIELNPPTWYSATIEDDAQDNYAGNEAADTSNPNVDPAVEDEPESNTVTNQPTTYSLDLNKVWTGSAAGTWPDGFSVKYQLVRNYHVVHANANGYTLGAVLKSEDVLKSEIENASGTITNLINPVHIGDLPTYGFINGSELTAKEREAASASGVAITDGARYLVAYTYSVRETSVNKGEAPNEISIDFAPQSAQMKPVVTGEEPDAVVSRTHYTATLTNDLTNLTIKKEWKAKGAEEPSAWPDGAVVNYRIEQVAKYQRGGASRTINTRVILDTGANPQVNLYGVTCNPLTSNGSVTIEGLPTSGTFTFTNQAEAEAAGLLTDVAYPVAYSYRVVEDPDTSVVPANSGYTYAAITALPDSSGNVTFVNEYTDIQVKKVWKKSGQNATWPTYKDDGVDKPYEVNWKVVQLASDGSKVDPYYVANGVGHEDAKLTSSNTSYDLKNLPTKGLHDGKTVTYSYVVYEQKDGSMPSTYPFQAVRALPNDGNTVFTLENDLTDVQVQKEWVGELGTSATVQLYSTTIKPDDTPTADVTVILDKWLPKDNGTGTTIPTEAQGPVTGVLTGGGIERPFELYPDSGWRAVFYDLPTQDSSDNPITYSVTSLSGLEGIAFDSLTTEDGDITLHLKANGIDTTNMVKYRFKIDGDSDLPDTSGWYIWAQVFKPNNTDLHDVGSVWTKEMTITDTWREKGQYLFRIGFGAEDGNHSADDYVFEATGSHNNWEFNRNNETGEIEIPIKIKKKSGAVPNTAVFGFVSGSANNGGWGISVGQFAKAGDAPHYNPAGAENTIGTINSATRSISTESSQNYATLAGNTNYVMRINPSQFNTVTVECAVGSFVYADSYLTNDNGKITINGNQSVKFVFKTDENGSLYLNFTGTGSSTTIQSTSPKPSALFATKTKTLARKSKAVTPEGDSTEPKTSPAPTDVTQTVTVNGPKSDEISDIIVIDSSGLPEGAEPVGDPVVLDGTADENGEDRPWHATWSDLPKKDAEGNDIYYYVVETKAAGPDNIKSTTATYTGNGVYNNDGKVNVGISNKTEDKLEYGSLEVTKQISGVLSDKYWTQDPKKEYKFSLQSVSTGKYLKLKDGASGNEIAETDTEWSNDPYYFTITATDKIVFKKLTAGNYVLQEDESTLQIPAYTYVKDQSITGTPSVGLVVRANAQESFEFKNVYEPELTDVQATKAWLNHDGSTEPPEGAKVTFALLRGEAQIDTIELDGKVDEQGEDTPWVASWTNLRKYNDNEEPYAYTVKEISRTPDHYAPDAESVASGGTITNKEGETSISVTKTWKTGNKDKVFDSAKTINFKLYQKYVKNDGTVVKSLYSTETFDGLGTITYTPAQGDTAASWSTETFEGLPTMVYDEVDDAWYKATYYVEEDPLSNVDVSYYYLAENDEGYDTTATAENAAVDGGTITIQNADSMVNLTVEKTWVDDAKAGWDGDDLNASVPYEIYFMVQKKADGDKRWSDFDSNDDDEIADGFVLAYGGGAAPTYSIKWYNTEELRDAAGSPTSVVPGKVLPLPAGYQYRVVETGYKVLVHTDAEHPENNVVIESPREDEYGQDFRELGTATYDGETGDSAVALKNWLEDIVITGKKAWVDNRANHEVPELIISRMSAKPDSSEEVLKAAASSKTEFSYGLTKRTGEGEAVNLQPVWTENGGTQTYEYTNLPKYDEYGYVYTYTVHEANPVTHEAVENGGTMPFTVEQYDTTTGTGESAVTTTHDVTTTYEVAESLSGDASGFGKDFTNEELVEIQVTKSWYEGATPDDKKKIEYRLERSSDGGATWGVVKESEQDSDGVRTLMASSKPEEKPSTGSFAKMSDEEWNQMTQDQWAITPEAWVQTISGLPLYKWAEVEDATVTPSAKRIEKTAYTYRVVEVKVNDGNDGVGVQYADGQFGSGQQGDWMVENPEPSELDAPGVNYGLKNGERVLIGTQEPTTFAMSNSKQRIYISGKKTWIANSSTELPDLSISLYAQSFRANRDALTGRVTYEAIDGKPEQKLATWAKDGSKTYGDDEYASRFNWAKPSPEQMEANQPIVWSYIILDLPRLDEDGNLIRYRVEEKVSGTNADKFTSDATSSYGEVDAQTGNVFNADFTNTEMTKVKVKKVWKIDETEVDDPGATFAGPESIKVHLYQYRENESAVELTNKAVTITKQEVDDPDNPGQRKWVWPEVVVDNLPKYYMGDSLMKEYRYYFIEDVPETWNAVYSGKDVVTNETVEDDVMGSSIRVSSLEDGAVTITNFKSTTPLPNTGGPGTVGFAALGGALAIGAAGILLRNRRKQQ